MLNLSDCINTRNDTIRDDVCNFLGSFQRVANGSFPTHSSFAAFINRKKTYFRHKMHNITRPSSTV